MPAVLSHLRQRPSSTPERLIKEPSRLAVSVRRIHLEHHNLLMTCLRLASGLCQTKLGKILVEGRALAIYSVTSPASHNLATVVFEYPKAFSTWPRLSP